MDDAAIATSYGQDGYAVARIIGLSDGIFAIAMTLLVLDLPVPQITHATDGELLSALGDLRSNFASFALSFALVGVNWMNHHRMLRNVVRSDRLLLSLNLALLLLVCLVPFTAAVLSRYGDLATGVSLYATNLFAMGLVSTFVRLHVSHAGLLEPRPDREQLRGSLVGGLVATVVFAASIPIAFWKPAAAEFFWLVLLTVPFAGTLRRRFRSAGVLRQGTARTR